MHNFGSGNTALGGGALNLNTTGSQNTALGSGALNHNTTGAQNTAVGNSTLISNTTGGNNTAVGASALTSNTTGVRNTAVGFIALLSNIDGNDNIALGYRAGADLTSGSNNIYLGNPGVSTESGTIRIGTPGTHNHTHIPGTLHYNFLAGDSDARLKTNITPLTHVLEKLEQLRGVSFEWNDASAVLTGRTPGQRDIGVIAQEVEAVFPELVTTWGEDGYKAVAYEKLTGVLLAAVKELKAETDAQQQRIAAMEERLAALERRAGTPQLSGQLSFSSLSAGWPLFGGLLLVGLVLRRHWQAKGQRM
jgi:hypothetical protein